ncbi:PrsW family intramembrane metalloprotease [Halomicrobium salinisoli]|uniref:PrsW family intramembrane metalloprotease n=1 Tax=Halomicrobium salinisoli TaxID=2878391 RepID=UPI001CEFDF61|nr:PrsW family glutamic-type intramembrane protease [Halomicrobium salinisoli]
MAPRRRDPVEARSDGSDDLYEVADWEVRSRVDWLAYWLYRALVVVAKGIVIVAALGIMLSQFVLGGLGAVTDPVVGAFTLLSAVPALMLAAYVWHADVTTSEPLSLLVVTFLLGMLLAGFAGVVNEYVGAPIRDAVPLLGPLLFFFLVVGPVEETVKLLAVRLVAYRSPRFDAVIDGAVYGAVAGLGFATIENALYITRTTGATINAAEAIGEVGGITFVRSLAGPGHVIYSAFAGYYLGLAKFNPDDAGPIVLKGLLIAAVIHGTYNTLAGIAPAVLVGLYPLSPFGALFVFVLVFDGLFGLVLLRKLSAYERAYVQTGSVSDDLTPERTEFDP